MYKLLFCLGLSLSAYSAQAPFQGLDDDEFAAHLDKVVAEHNLHFAKINAQLKKQAQDESHDLAEDKLNRLVEEQLGINAEIKAQICADLDKAALKKVGPVLVDLTTAVVAPKRRTNLTVSVGSEQDEK